MLMCSTYKYMPEGTHHLAWLWRNHRTTANQNMPVCHFCTPEQGHIGRNVVYINTFVILPWHVCFKFGLQLPTSVLLNKQYSRTKQARLCRTSSTLLQLHHEQYAYSRHLINLPQKASLFRKKALPRLRSELDVIWWERKKLLKPHHGVCVRSVVLCALHMGHRQLCRGGRARGKNMHAKHLTTPTCGTTLHMYVVCHKPKTASMCLLSVFIQCRMHICWQHIW